jgi:prepilin-type N-terminal cleavage/methylation domain-containing protein
MTCAARECRRQARGGFSLLEVLVATTILLVLVGSLATTLGAMKGVTTAGGTQSRLQEAGERILKLIAKDMKRSGFVQVGGKDYPFLFNEGNADQDWQGTPTAGFSVHSHPAPTHAAQPGELDFGLTREAVFALPQDADADGVPDIDVNGALVWDAQEFSYVLVTRPDGINYLERRTDGTDGRVIGMFVERIAFDHNASTLLTPDPVPLGAMRVQVFLRQQDGEGSVHRYTARAVVRMRNGAL